jgi:homoserine O-acetyltransferase/O-succinyltransferase
MTRTTELMRIHDVPLDAGGRLEWVDVAYHLDGHPTPARDNLVLVHHALTGSADAAGDWWRDVIGTGRAVDTSLWAVLSTNLLGSCYGTAASAPLSRVTTRDQARLAQRVVSALGFTRVAMACGGSLGGMVAFESLASFPDSVDRAVIFAAPARQSALGAAWGAVMRRALELGGPSEGLALARMIGMISYRTSPSLQQKVRASTGDDAVVTASANAWLERHGARLVERFDATAYRTLIDAMDTHDVARGRDAGAVAALADRIVSVGVPGDLLYPADDVWEWSRANDGATATIRSMHGHDAFLLETDQVGSILAEQLAVIGAQRNVSITIHSPNTNTVVDTTARKRDSGIARSARIPTAVPSAAPTQDQTSTSRPDESTSGARAT